MSIHFTSFLWLSFIIGLLTLSCGRATEDTGTVTEEAERKAAEALENAENEAAAEVADFRMLKALLPETLAGMERIEHSGQRSGAMGINVSVAQAKYESGDATLDVVITDTGGLVGAAMGLAAWATVEMDRETQSGYERTTTIEGYKAFESYNRDSKSGEFSVLVNDRIILVMEGRNIEEKNFRNAFKQLELSKLEDLQ